MSYYINKYLQENSVRRSLVAKDIEDAREAVQKGIDLLDETFGADWRDHVDLGTLDIQSFRNCLLGQVFGGFCQGIDDIVEHADSETLEELQKQAEPYLEDIGCDRKAIISSVAGFDFIVLNQFSLTVAWIEALSDERFRPGPEEAPDQMEIAFHTL